MTVFVARGNTGPAVAAKLLAAADALGVPRKSVRSVFGGYQVPVDVWAAAYSSSPAEAVGGVAVSSASTPPVDGIAEVTPKRKPGRPRKTTPPGPVST